MKPHHKSYMKTIVLAIGLAVFLGSVAVLVMNFGADFATKLDTPAIRMLSAVIPMVLIPVIALSLAVASGGFLSLYREVSRSGRP